MSLRTRFALILGATAVLLVTGLSVALYVVEKNSALEKFERVRRDETERLAVVCREAALSKDEIPLANYLKALKNSGDIRAAACLDAVGNVAAHTDFALKGRALDDAPARWARGVADFEKKEWAADGAPPTVDYAAPVRREDEKIGAAWIRYDAERLQQQARQVLREVFRRFAGVALAGLMIGLGLAWPVAGALARPIALLTDGVRRVGQGDLTAQVPVARQDEIGELSREFNAMARRLGELDKLKEEFIQTVSHDLRNPLGAIKSTAVYLMQKENTVERRDQAMKLIVSSTNRLETMVNNILDMATIREGRMEYKKTGVGPKDLVEEATALFAFSASEKGIALRADISGDLPTVQVDREKMHRVFTNLIANAMKFTEEGGRVTVGAKRLNGAVEFFVADTGPGIPPEELPRLFQRFATVSSVNADLGKKQGTGLGLQIVKTIVQAHGGQVRVESAVGQGTTFRWSVPS